MFAGRTFTPRRSETPSLSFRTTCLRKFVSRAWESCGKRCPGLDQLQVMGSRASVPCNCQSSVSSSYSCQPSILSSCSCQPPIILPRHCQPSSLVSCTRKFVIAMDSRYVERRVFLFAPKTIKQLDSPCLSAQCVAYVCAQSDPTCLLTACTAQYCLLKCACTQDSIRD